MGLPSGSKYAISPLPNPASDLTDAVVGIDVSRFPQEWWDAVDTTDQTKARAALDDETELAFDFQTFDSTAQTGWIWVRVAGTIPASGTTPKVRVYPPQSANTSYSPTATYGRNATWVDYEAVFHTEAVDTTSLEDSTGNGYDTSIYYEDGQYLEQVDGMFGKAALFDHVWEHQIMANPITFDEGMSIQTWLTPSVDKTTSGFTGDYSADGIAMEVGYGRFHFNDSNGNTFFYYPFGYGSGESFTVGTNYKTTFTKDSNSKYTGYLNGTSSGEFYDNNNTHSAPITIDRIGTWKDTDFFDGTVEEFRVANFVIGSDLESYQHLNESDQATFWGTWNVEGGVVVTALEPNDLTQPHSLSGSSVAAKYSLVVDSGLHNHLLESSTIAGHNYSVVPNELLQDHLLDSSTIAANYSVIPNDLLNNHSLESAAITGHSYSLVANELLQDHLIDGSAITGHSYSVNPESQQLSQLLEASNIAGHNYIVLPEELTQQHSLDQSELIVVGDILLVPDSIEHPHSISESSLEVLYSLLPTDMQQDYSVDSLNVSVAYKLTPDQLDQDHLLGSGSITTSYLITPDDISQSHELEQALLQIIGEASQVSLEANELYLINLQEEKLYKVKLEEQEQYEMNIKVEERVS